MSDSFFSGTCRDVEDIVAWLSPTQRYIYICVCYILDKCKSKCITLAYDNAFFSELVWDLVNEYVWFLSFSLFSLYHLHSTMCIS